MLADALGLVLEAAHAAGTELAGHGLEQVLRPLVLLEQLARRARVPDAVWRPMPSDYSPPRFFLADLMAGAPVQPVRGLAPGRPAATHWFFPHPKATL